MESVKCYRTIDWFSAEKTIEMEYYRIKVILVIIVKMVIILKIYKIPLFVEKTNISKKSIFAKNTTIL